MKAYRSPASGSRTKALTGAVVAALCLVSPSFVGAAEAEKPAFRRVPDSVRDRIEVMKMTPPKEDPAPVWDYANQELQLRVDQTIEQLGLKAAVRDKRLSLALLDITDLENPALASLNGDKMFYAASLPKIAILLAAFEEIASGKLELTPDLESEMKKMIRDSSNSAATYVMLLVGQQRIAEVLTSSRYRLYDPLRGGGLWAGKEYAKAGLWRRDPMHNLSHGATALEVARFWYMLETNRLVTPEHCEKMREILGVTHINHKFAKAIMGINQYAEIMRKSGSWRTYHADSALIRHRGYAYIIVGLSNDKDGGRWLENIGRELDGVIAERNPKARAAALE